MKTVWKILIVLGAIALLLLIAVPVALIATKTLPFGEKVKIIPIKGTITLGDCSPSLIEAGECAQVQTIKELLEEADEDDSVKAIVLDINSGGGYVVASRELMRAVQETEKPVVAWIGEAGASGAYYTASAADYIVADRDSITGSIGVITSVMHYYGLMEKIGVNVTVVKAGNSKDIGSPYRPMTEDEYTEMKDMVDDIYYDFIRDIAKNRNLDVEYTENISGGKLYLGSEAKELGLVDDLGGIDYAVEVAGRLGGIEGEPKVERAEIAESLDDILNRMSVNVGYGIGNTIFKLKS